MIETKPRINRGNRGQLFRATWLSSARCSETFRRTTERVECSAKCTWQWPRTGLNLFQILPTSWRDHEQWTKDPKNVAVVLSERWEKPNLSHTRTWPNHVKKVQHIGSKINFMTCYGCRYCYSTEVLLCETIEQLGSPFLSNRITSWNPRWRRPANLKAKIGDNQILFCLTLKCYFHVFQRNFKVDCIFNNLTLICFKSAGFF